MVGERLIHIHGEKKIGTIEDLVKISMIIVSIPIPYNNHYYLYGGHHFLTIERMIPILFSSCQKVGVNNNLEFSA